MESETAHIYSDLVFPKANLNRPYTYIDMVSTIDGKILSGERGESVMDLGSPLDHRLMKKIASVSDAVLVGAETVRASPRSWNPSPKIRIVVSASGDLPYEAAFFKETAYVAHPASKHLPLPSPVRGLGCGEDKIDFVQLLSKLRDLGVERLLVLGGSRVNGELLRNSLVDELFLTIAPKVKLGDDVPTYAGGDPFKRNELPIFEIVETHTFANEVFLRYRRADQIKAVQ